MNQKRGRRWSATKAYLQPIRSRKNLTILTKTLVHRVNVARENSSLVAQSVTTSSFDDAAKKTKIYAKKEVILAAGAIGSPQILQLSGIGNAKNLAEVGIELKVDLPGVGENLHDHLQLRSIYSVENRKRSTINSILSLESSLWD